MTRETFNEVKSFIKEIGFPIMVALWLLYEAHTTLKELSVTLTEVKNAMVLIQSKLQ